MGRAGAEGPLNGLRRCEGTLYRAPYTGRGTSAPASSWRLLFSPFVAMPAGVLAGVVAPVEDTLAAAVVAEAVTAANARQETADRRDTERARRAEWRIMFSSFVGGARTGGAVPAVGR
ncbi:hypothetical protein GCM10010234_69000 [Streptomyces hawaiiensis]